MCGIVGYVGDDDAKPVLLHGLQKLEYRGYDSAGIAVRDQLNERSKTVPRDYGKHKRDLYTEEIYEYEIKMFDT